MLLQVLYNFLFISNENYFIVIVYSGSLMIATGKVQCQYGCKHIKRPVETETKVNKYHESYYAVNVWKSSIAPNKKKGKRLTNEKHGVEYTASLWNSSYQKDNFPEFTGSL